MDKAKQIFQDNLLTQKVIKEIVETIFPHTLIPKWATSTLGNNENIKWV